MLPDSMAVIIESHDALIKTLIDKTEAMSLRMLVVIEILDSIKDRLDDIINELDNR